VPLRTRFFTVAEHRTMRAEAFRWEHEIRVALPSSYDETEQNYPVLWLTDNDLECALAVLGDAQVILVAVGAGSVSEIELAVRRAYDFYPTEDFVSFDGPGSDLLREELERRYPSDMRPKGGGAGRFLDFLVDDVWPALAADYRFEAEEHGLVGGSAGGAFVAYALFARPGTFSTYICGSPTLNACNFNVFELERRYAETHDDLPARVFFGAGEAELTEPVISEFGCVSSLARMVETLTLRRYPSLRLSAKIFADETHETAHPHVLRWGVRSTWGDRVFGRPS
jgi:predicted alpha/beta superfamily hydrolase